VVAFFFNMNILKNALLLLATAAPFCLSAQNQISQLPPEVQGEDCMHIKRYIGRAQACQEQLALRNTFYWSVGTEVNGQGRIKAAMQTFSTGVGQADFRLCTYEDGSPVFENGKYFFCVSSRMSGCGQTIYSLDINTCKMTLVGNMQGYVADGEVRGMIAPHIIYNRKDGKWYIFAHWGNPHHICVGRSLRDPRYGYNEITCQLLDYESPAKGDEDSFVYFDEQFGKWVLVYSKSSTELYRQLSDRIDGGYKLDVVNKDHKTLTGINVVKIGGKRYILSGYGWTPQEDAYKVFNADDLSYRCDINLDMKTGGFRGWGTILDVIEGETTKYQLLTFDRVNPNGVTNWEYGNIYLYESKERNPGIEYDLVQPFGSVVKSDIQCEYKPEDLHFIRRFSQRFNYAQEIPTARIDMSYIAFQPKGTPYPVKDKLGDVAVSQDDNGLIVKGKGCFSIIGGAHLPTCEYIIDLSDIHPGEVRYFKLGTLDKELVNLRFSASNGRVSACLSNEKLLDFSDRVTKLRLIFLDNTVHFLDATPVGE